MPAAHAEWPSRDLDEGSGEREAPAAASDEADGAVAPAPVDALTPMPTMLNAPAPPRPYEPATPYAAERAYQPTAFSAGPDYRSGGEDGGGLDEPGWTGRYDDDEPRRRGSGALAILGFLVLGLAALLGGAFLFAALNAPSPVSQVSSPSPTPSATSAESGSSSPSAGESPTEGATPSPASPADNFSAKVEPCASNRMGFSGCVDDGTRLSGDQVWVWVGFKNGQASTVIGVTIISNATKSAVGDGSLELDQLVGCDPGKTCSGYMQMSFGNLAPGGYRIDVTRDDDKIASTSFTVSG